MQIKYHDPSVCVGQRCCLHNPSDHHMKEWPLVLKMGGHMERTCSHGIGHPDPDSLWYFEVVMGEMDEVEWRGVHGCDGCCRREA